MDVSQDMGGFPKPGKDELAMTQNCRQIGCFLCSNVVYPVRNHAQSYYWWSSIPAPPKSWYHFGFTTSKTPRLLQFWFLQGAARAFPPQEIRVHYDIVSAALFLQTAVFWRSGTGSTMAEMDWICEWDVEPGTRHIGFPALRFQVSHGKCDQISSCYRGVGL